VERRSEGGGGSGIGWKSNRDFPQCLARYNPSCVFMSHRALRMRRDFTTVDYLVSLTLHMMKWS